MGSSSSANTWISGLLNPDFTHRFHFSVYAIK
uniref:Uncharacterized protein n=1 Tax=Anguilla anguilla TaxID=7936 RepID=A0A0E9PSR8_ANGAN